MKTAVLSCGALAREVQHICQDGVLSQELFFVQPLLHLEPAKLRHTLTARLTELEKTYERTLVVYGWCLPGMDDFLAQFNARRIQGEHCLEMIGGDRFWKIIRDCPGTYFLIPSWIFSFPEAIVKGLQLDREPRMKEIMFRHYQKIVYFDTLLYGNVDQKVTEIAEYLELPMEIERVGVEVLRSRLVKELGQE